MTGPAAVSLLLPQPGPSSFASQGLLLFPPEPLLLFLESQAPGELWGHIGTVPVWM